MKLKDANRDFDLQYVEIWIGNSYEISSSDVNFDGDEQTVERVVKRYPEAEGQIGFDFKKGGFTFIGSIKATPESVGGPYIF
jgi:hypothetical protein